MHVRAINSCHMFKIKNFQRYKVYYCNTLSQYKAKKKTMKEKQIPYEVKYLKRQRYFNCTPPV